MDTFHERLSLSRKSSGMTQKEVADILGVSQPGYSKYEYGLREPKFEILVRLADLFSVTTDYLLCREEQKKATKILMIDGIELEISIKK